MSKAYDPVQFGRTLADLSERAIAESEKGFFAVGPIAASRLVGTPISDLGLPLAVIDMKALDHNIARMADYCRRAGVELAPHAKTTMSPQIFGRQLRAGAWGLTVANVGQAQICIDHGALRVMIANEVVDPQEIAWMAGIIGEDRAEIMCFVDTVAGAARLAAGLRRAGAQAPLSILLEVGQDGFRGGVRSRDVAIAIAAFVRDDPLLGLRGVAGFEGVLAGDRRPESIARVDAFCGWLLDVAVLVEPFVEPIDDVGTILISAGGSVYFDRVTTILLDERRVPVPRRVILRSGAYVTHDHGYLGNLSPLADSSEPFRAALEVRALVLSVPDRGQAIVGAGKRDMGSDIAPPTPARTRRGAGPWRSLDGVVVTGLNDQHARLAYPDGRTLDSEFQVGDIVTFGVAHPCTTLDRWRFIPLVQGDVIVDVAHTFF